MCLATPMKIMEIKGDKAIVSSEEHTHEVNLSLIKEPKIGDYILAHADLAINKLPLHEAEKILALIKDSKKI